MVRVEITHWPLYGLRLRTPRLELRLPMLEELDELAQLAAEGIHEPSLMPFVEPWTDLPPAERARGVMQYHWRQLGEWVPGNWNLNLTVFLDGTVVGTQAMSAQNFSIMRQVSTGSWLGRRYQRQGIGTEMRAGVLQLAFAGLDAEAANTAAFTDNQASAAVSRKLGYQPNGIVRSRVRDAVGFEQRFTLDPVHWKEHRTVPVEIDGLDPCLPQFGL